MYYMYMHIAHRGYVITFMHMPLTTQQMQLQQMLQLRYTKNSNSSNNTNDASNVSFDFSLILQFYISFMEMNDAVHVTNKLNNQLYTCTHTYI